MELLSVKISTLIHLPYLIMVIVQCQLMEITQLPFRKLMEDYDNMKSELCDIISDVENLTFIVFNGIHHTVYWYLGGNWKFLAMVMRFQNFHVSGGNTQHKISLTFA